MTPWILWFVVAGVLAVAEIITGTLYLLLAALGALAAALASYLGYDSVVQIMTASSVLLAGWFILKKLRPQKSRGDEQSNSDMNMDIGSPVKIASVSPEGEITVSYRGSIWQAELESGELDSKAQYKIIRIEGSKLILVHV